MCSSFNKVQEGKSKGTQGSCTEKDQRTMFVVHGFAGSQFLLFLHRSEDVHLQSLVFGMNFYSHMVLIQHPAFCLSMICLRFIKLSTFYDPFSVTFNVIIEKTNLECLNDVPKAAQLVSTGLGLESRATGLSQKAFC